MKIRHFLFCVIVLVASNSMSAQEITMFQGFWSMKYYQDNKQISKQEVQSLIAQDVVANQLWQKSKKHRTVAWIAIGAEVGFLAWQINRRNNFESQTVPLVGVLASAGVAIGFSLSSANLQKDAILEYNENVDVGSINLGPTQNGFGLVFSF